MLNSAVIPSAARNLHYRVIPSAARNLHYRVIPSAARNLLLVFLAAPLGAQSIATRVAQAPDGVVRMEFDSRPGTCGDGRDLVGYRNALFARNLQTIGRWHSDRCVPGPLRVTLWVDDRQVTREETQVAGEWHTTDARITDLGVVPSREASAYLFSLVPRLEEASGKDRLLLPAVLAADAEVMAPLLAIARDEDRSLHTRRQAIHWLGMMGDESVVPALTSFARRDDFAGKRGKDGLSSSAMAALGNLEGGVGVPALIDLARTGSTEMRRNAVFWLGQNGDPRGVRVLHSVIENRDEDERVRQHAIFSLSQSRDVADAELAYLRGVYPKLDEYELQEAVFQGMTQDETRDAGAWLVAHALDERESMRLRRSALFWAGQRAATPTAELVRVYRDAREEELKEHAIFVLSQRQDDEATDALLRIAREEKDRELRGKALFWLAQKHDPRVTKLISDLLR